MAVAWGEGIGRWRIGRGQGGGEGKVWPRPRGGAASQRAGGSFTGSLGKAPMEFFLDGWGNGRNGGRKMEERTMRSQEGETAAQRGVPHGESLKAWLQGVERNQLSVHMSRAGFSLNFIRSDTPKF